MDTELHDVDALADTPTDTRVILQMTRIATTATQAVEAIQQEQVQEARQRIDKLRTQWSTLSRGDARQLAPRQTRVHSGSGVEAVHHGAEVLSICNQVIQAWTRERCQSAMSRAEAMTVDDWQAVLDHVLPMKWNFQCDILVVHGLMPEPLAAAIRARHQQRTFHHHPETRKPTVPGITPVQDVDAINRHVAAIAHAVPKRTVSLDLGEGLLSVEQVEAANAAVSNAIQNLRMNWVTWRLFSQRWLEQGLTNLSLIARSPEALSLQVHFQGLPAIIVSPGPSLDGNIEHLRRAQGRALLLAPLQTLKRLYREGIRPDFAVVLDAADQTSDPMDFLGGIDPEYLPDLLACKSAHANVLEKFRRVHFFFADSPVDHLLASARSQQSRSVAAGSVSITCMRLALHWGCSPVILVGQDLAFSGEQRYASKSDIIPMPTSAVLRTLPGYHGGTVSTAPDYFLFHHQFQEIAAESRRARPELVLLNCTEGGASIRGFDQVSLHEALARHVDHLPLRPHPATLPVDGPEPGLPEGMLRCLQQYLGRAREGLRLADQAEVLARKAHVGGPPVRRQLTEVDKALRGLTLALKPWMQDAADKIDDALTAWEAFDDLEDYLEGSRLFREAAREGLRLFERRLAGVRLDVSSSA